jgi:short-subunit dehydrogenase
MKVIVITGASSGIGRQTALALASSDVQLVLAARRRGLLEELQTEIVGRGGHAAINVTDLRVREDIERLVAVCNREYGRIDILINNAGFGYFGTVEHMAPELMDEILAVNFIAPVIAIQAVLPIMRAQRSGHIINVSSVAGRRGLPLSGIYSATKFALNGISEAMRVELRDAGIHISVVYPVATATPFFDVVQKGDVDGRFKPVGYVQPAEKVANCIVRCIRRPRSEVYPYWPGRLLVWANAFLPSLIDRAMLPYFRERVKARRK